MNQVIGIIDEDEQPLFVLPHQSGLATDNRHEKIGDDGGCGICDHYPDGDKEQIMSIMIKSRIDKWHPYRVQNTLVLEEKEQAVQAPPGSADKPDIPLTVEQVGRLKGNNHVNRPEPAGRSPAAVNEGGDGNEIQHDLQVAETEAFIQLTLVKMQRKVVDHYCGHSNDQDNNLLPGNEKSIATEQVCAARQQPVESQHQQ